LGVSGGGYREKGYKNGKSSEKILKTFTF